MPPRVLQKWEKFSRSQRTIEHEHGKIHDGDAYTLSIQTSLASAGSFSVLLTVPSSKSIHFRTVRIRPEAGPIIFQMFRDPATNINSFGTEVMFENMNQQVTKVTSLAAYINPVTSVLSLGAEIENELIPAPGVQGGGSANATPFEWVLKRDSKYLMLFGSQGGNTQMSYTVFVYESTSV